MGCWNKTCGISNLHILDGQEVYVFAIERNTNRTDRCYSTAFWKPVLLPWVSRYNDYGVGEDDQGAVIPHILEGIKDDMIELDQGENQYHDIPVKKDGFDLEKFYEAVQESRLQLHSPGEGGVDVDFVMMRKDVVDDIFNNWRVEKYMGEGKGNCGWSNSYIKYGFAQVLNDLPEFMEELISNVQDNDPMRLFMRGLDRVFPYEHSNLVSAWMRRDTHRYSSIVRVDQLIYQLIRDGKLDEAHEVMVAHLKGVYIDGFMEQTRKAWAPGAFEGSQANSEAGYRSLCAAIERALAADRKRWGDDEEDEE